MVLMVAEGGHQGAPDGMEQLFAEGMDPSLLP